MKTFQDKEKSKLIKKLHTLVSKAGITREEYLSLLSCYCVESSKDLTVYELMELCSKIDNTINVKEYRTLDRWRKRLIASIGGYLKKMGKESNMDIIIGIACRAAGVDKFNSIGLDKLRSLYNAFKFRSTAIDKTEKIALEAVVNAEFFNKETLQN
ncbi:MAG: hypothetical protein R3Y59_02850 [bacterium]